MLPSGEISPLGIEPVGLSSGVEMNEDGKEV
jgi:hypothetical protein